jgi:hypothetical protein
MRWECTVTLTSLDPKAEIPVLTACSLLSGTAALILARFYKHLPPVCTKTGISDLIRTILDDPITVSLRWLPMSMGKIHYAESHDAV